MIRENLQLPPGADKEQRAEYIRLVGALSYYLCQQDRLGEALQMLEAQRRLLADSGGSEEDILKVDLMRGELLARSGNAEEALKIFLNAAANRRPDAGNWSIAVNLAVATGDRETYRGLCRTGLLRFASTAQGGTPGSSRWVCSRASPTRRRCQWPVRWWRG
jgi:hypothetical protein